MSNVERSTRGLIVIARNAHGQIVSRITSRYELAGTLRTVCSLLKLKPNGVGVEVHLGEEPTSIYPGKPLVAISVDDLVLIHQQMS